jgi:hypothetical protein
MKKIYLLILVIALLIVAIVWLRPRHVVKEGYIYGTMHDIRYVDNVTQVAGGRYLPAHGEREILIYFDEANRSLYNSVKPTSVLKVRFEGKYYPFAIHNTPMKVKLEPKLVLQKLTDSQSLAQ